MNGNPPTKAPPVVLVCAGADPSGGAGIQADIQSLTALGCHPAPVVTAITVQDTRQVYRYLALEVEWVLAQIEAVLDDMEVVAVKLGMLGSVPLVKALGELLQSRAPIRLVLDPVLASGAGGPLAEKGMVAALQHYLLPYTELLTPNTLEAQSLSGISSANPAAQAQFLQAKGCKQVLITGSHAEGATIVHRLYGAQATPKTLECPRLPGHFHGSGCTLAAAITAGLAHDLPLFEAVSRAQHFTWQSLKTAHTLGRGQMIPNRRC